MKARAAYCSRRPGSSSSPSPSGDREGLGSQGWGRAGRRHLCPDAGLFTICSERDEEPWRPEVMQRPGLTSADRFLSSVRRPVVGSVMNRSVIFEALLCFGEVLGLRPSFLLLLVGESAFSSFGICSDELMVARGQGVTWKVVSSRLGDTVLSWPGPLPVFIVSFSFGFSALSGRLFSLGRVSSYTRFINLTTT
jgi:hypothetical protein